MKLRSLSIFIVAAIGLGFAAGYNSIKRHVRKKIRSEVTKVFDEKAKQLEEDLVDKYDIQAWEDTDIEEFNFDDDTWTSSCRIVPLSEADVVMIDDQKVREHNAELECPHCMVDLNSNRNVVCPPPKVKNIVRYI